MRNRGVSSPMPFLLIPRSLLRGGFISRNRRKLHVAIVGSKGPQPTRQRIESQAVYKKPGGRLKKTQRIVEPYR